MRAYTWNTLEVWLTAWIALAEALVKIITLGYIIPSWEFKIIAFFVKRKLKKKTAKLKKHE